MIHRALITFVLAGLLTQAIIPVGFMPASLSSGWFIAWCPGQLSPGAMEALMGDAQNQAHHDHHHHHHGHHSHDEHANGSFNYQPCDLIGLSGFISSSNVDHKILWLQQAFLSTKATLIRRVHQTYPAYWSQAPPLFSLI